MLVPEAPPGTPNSSDAKAEAQREVVLAEMAAADAEREAARQRAEWTAAQRRAQLEAERRRAELEAEREAARQWAVHQAAVQARIDQAWAAGLYESSGAARRDRNEAWWREHPEDAPAGWLEAERGHAG
jgi:hypothetical protein